MKKLTRIPCKECNKGDGMYPTSKYKMGPIVVAIGWIIATPSMICLLFCGISLGVMLMKGEIGGAFMIMFLGVMCLVSGLLGYLLIMRRKIFLCGTCGSIKERG